MKKKLTDQEIQNFLNLLNFLEEMACIRNRIYSEFLNDFFATPGGREFAKKLMGKQKQIKAAGQRRRA